MKVNTPKPTEQIAIDFPNYRTPKGMNVLNIQSEPNPHDRTAKQLIANRIEKDSYLQSHVYRSDYVRAIDSVLFHNHCAVYKMSPAFKNGEYYYQDRDYQIREMLLDLVQKDAPKQAKRNPIDRLFDIPEGVSVNLKMAPSGYLSAIDIASKVFEHPIVEGTEMERKISGFLFSSYCEKFGTTPPALYGKYHYPPDAIGWFHQ
ncbi:hypothetical protein [Chamaesiphon sp.]|uniref:hypothetical protein n=1 Tax=Chamaesiphon sp. TaxID=2814140 RepID=UPI003593DDD6